MRFAKEIFILMLLASPQIGFAAADCSEAANGKVKVTYTGNDVSTASYDKALSEAFSCLVTNNESVREKLLKALERGSADFGAEKCRLDASSLNAFVFRSWDETKDSNYGVRTGERSYSLAPAVICSAVGSGLYEGVTAHAFFRITVKYESTGAFGNPEDRAATYNFELK